MGDMNGQRSAMKSVDVKQNEPLSSLRQNLTGDNQKMRITFTSHTYTQMSADKGPYSNVH